MKNKLLSIILSGVIAVTAVANATISSFAAGIEYAPMGDGLNGVVFDSAVLPNGDLVVAGNFTQTTNGSKQLNYIAVWDGYQWDSLGNGFDAPVWWVDVTSTGGIIAVGQFVLSQDATLQFNRVAYWNGGTWASMGTGLNDIASFVHVSDHPATLDEIYVGGDFTATADGAVTLNHLAHWNASSGAWETVGGGLSHHGMVTPIITLSNGDIVAGGSFTHAGGIDVVDNVARWDGTTWHSMGGGLQNMVSNLVELPNGEILAAGVFDTSGGKTVFNVAKWNGAVWEPLGTGLGTVYGTHFGYAIYALSQDVYYFGGNFASTGDSSLVLNNIALWNVDHWEDVGGGANGTVWTIEMLPNEKLFFGGNFTVIGGEPISYASITKMGLGEVLVLGDAVINLGMGSLSISPSNINFGTMTLTGVDQYREVQVADWAATDATGSGDGWVVTVVATDFIDNSTGHTIDASNLLMKIGAANITKKEDGSSGVPVSSQQTYVALDTETQFLQAVGPDGMGSYYFTPDLKIIVPANSYEGLYESVLTVNIQSGP